MCAINSLLSLVAWLLHLAGDGFSVAKASCHNHFVYWGVEYNSYNMITRDMTKYTYECLQALVHIFLSYPS